MTVIAAISGTSILLLVFNIFNSFIAVIAGLLVTITIFYLFRVKLVLFDSRFDCAFLFILLIALLFRAQPYLYVLGGQDQGLYVNMSSAYQKNGSTFWFDQVRARLSDDVLINYYDNHNHFNLSLVESGKYEGQHFPGVYVKNLEKSEYVFQFYPLHPLWMAIFGDFFGSNNRIYSLVFFSIISIIAFYLLAYEISDHEKISSYIVSLFLALNPLHAFFSKFPVTEIVALAFTSTGFYLLVYFYKQNLRNFSGKYYLLLSSLMFSCFFFTRISGFLYLPIFFLILYLSFLFSEKSSIKSLFIYYFCLIIFFYFISICYGYIYSYPYSHDCYDKAFSKIFDQEWQFKLYIFCLAFLIFFSIFLIFIKIPKLNIIIKSTISFIENNLYIIFIVVLMISIYKIYQFSFTDIYKGNWWFDERWKMTGRGFNSISFSSLYAIILYLSPICFSILFFAILNQKYEKNHFLSILIAFVLFFLVATTVVAFTVPYQYYYARYLLSEVIPYSLLVVSIYLAFLILRRGKFRLLSYILISSICVYFFYYTAFQFSGKECQGVHDALSRVEHKLDDRDLLIILKENSSKYWTLNTAFSIYYNLPIFCIDEINDLTGKIYPTLFNFNDIFILSTHSISKNYLSISDIIAFNQGIYEHTNRIPTKFFYMKRDLYLYSLNKEYLINATFRSKNGFIPKLNLHYLRNFHTDGIFTNGNSSIININYSLSKADQYIGITTHGWTPFNNDIMKIGLKVFINKIEIPYSHSIYKINKHFFKLPAIDVIHEIRLVSNTFVPKKFKINNDERILGLDIANITIE